MDVVAVPAERLADVLRRCATTYGFEMLTDLSGADWLPREPRYDVNYHLLSLEDNERLRVKVQLADADEPHVPSVTGVYPGANWHEREVYDFFGIIFDGHPNLTRILMPDEWIGHPLAQGLSRRRCAGRVPDRAGVHRRERRSGPRTSGGRRRAGAAAARPRQAVALHVDRTAGERRAPDRAARRPRALRRRQRRMSDVVRRSTRRRVLRSETQDLWVEDETMRVNLGPQHPSTHGVLRLRVEVAGEVIVDVEPIIGYLHTGIEKQAETLNWIQAVTDVTRADYLSNFYNELAYCLAVEKLAGIEAPPRAQWIRMLMCEFNRISSHLVWLATGGMELGALSMATFAFRERETILDFYQAVTGLRMNHAYFRPGGVNMDSVPSTSRWRASCSSCSRSASPSTRTSCRTTRSGCAATRASACSRRSDAIALGVTGPNLRATGVAHDLRKKPKPTSRTTRSSSRSRSARPATATTGTSSG